ncbi:OpgC domain-containing protein [Horticoccus luteus]|uniref:OpgC domain-containing protein n=1 Tax=Horticoccus luteus TaxID=2862869 RepID=A0A8F9TYF3_9BACT|nr:OpgC domain-containing protein [Horticoccus luteus]QYM80518.1 OpgC domain-containing protein [Horticoccus luteus]
MGSALPAPTVARDLRFDSLRGLLIVCMAMNHIETPLRLVSDQPHGFVSSAEGFVFLSGFIAGWVYSRKRERGGDALLASGAQHRAGQIYVWHMATFFTSLALMTVVVLATQEAPPLLPALFAFNPWMAIVTGSLLLYQPGLLDILPMYCGFMLFLPWILRASAAGRAREIVLGSGAVWLLTQQFLPGAPVVIGPLNTGSFNLFAWQFLFVAGAVFGAEKAAGRLRFPLRSGWIAAAFLAAIGFWYLHRGALADVWPESVDFLVNKTKLAPLRLANFALIAYLIAACAARFPRWFTWAPFAFVGQHALPVFALQSVLAMTILAFSNFFFTPVGQWVATALMLGCLFGTAAIHAQWIKRHRTRKTHPVSLASRDGRSSAAPHVARTSAPSGQLHP